MKGAIVRVDGSQLGLLEPDPYLNIWPLNSVPQLGDPKWAVLRRDISKIPFRTGREHLLEIVPPHGPIRSLSFTVVEMKEPRFINFGFERNGTLAVIVYHRDGSMTFFPGGATL